MFRSAQNALIKEQQDALKKQEIEANKIKAEQEAKAQAVKNSTTQTLIQQRQAMYTRGGLFSNLGYGSNSGSKNNIF